jgi:hypothetical protein
MISARHNIEPLIDVLDRILDKSIVIDAWARVSPAGIDVLTVRSRVVVGSFETYLNYAEILPAIA